MVNILQSLSKTVHLSIALAILLFLGLFLVVAIGILIDFFGVGYFDIFICRWNCVDWTALVFKFCSDT